MINVVPKVRRPVDTVGFPARPPAMSRPILPARLLTRQQFAGAITFTLPASTYGLIVR